MNSKNEAPTAPPPSTTNANGEAAAPIGGATTNLPVHYSKDHKKPLQELAERMRVEPGNEAYLEALRQAPQVVQSEADPLQFLRREDYKVGAAARRMCNYWNKRKQVFSADRFAPPLLDLSGKGALSQEALAFMETGVSVVLPNDDQGRSVVGNDVSRLSLSGPEAHKFRSQYVFYLYCAPCRNPKTQTEGVVILRILRDSIETIQFSADQFKRSIVQLLKDAIPAKIHSLHICCLPSQDAAKRHLVKIILPQFVQALGNDLGKKAVIHCEGSSENMAKKLHSYGLRSVGLPSSLGGSWSYDTHRFHVLSQAEESQQIPFESEICDIPESEKQAYLEAVQLGALEDVAAYVKFFKGDKIMAARGLVDYWKNRKEIFHDRAFRPLLDLSGHGALTKQDIEALEDGFTCVQLPNTACGNSLIYLDQTCQSSSSKPVDSESRMRCTMYLLSRAAKDATTSGIILLRLVRQAEFDRQSLQQLASLTKCIPAEFPHLHFCCLPPRGGRRSNFMETFVPVYEQLLTVTFGEKAVVHVAQNSNKLFNELSGCGFQKNELPTSLGGSWSFDYVRTWLHGDESVATADSEMAKKPSAVKDGDVGLGGLLDAVHQARLEDRKARKRTMDAIYARKRRQREKGEEKTLQQQCFDLTSTNRKIEEENQRFEKMLEDAKTNIALVEYGMSIAGKKTQKKKKRKMAPVVPPASFAKKPKPNSASLIVDANRQHAASSSMLDFSSTLASTTPATSGIVPSAAEEVLDLLNTIESERQNAELKRQRDELLVQVLAAQRCAQEHQRVSDEQSFLQQLTEAVTGRNPQQASTAFLFNQKNTNQQAHLPLPLQFQSFSGAPTEQQTNIISERPPQQINIISEQLPPPPAESAAQSLLNQLLVANASQSNGLAGLQGLANAFATQPNPVAPQQTEARAPQTELLLQHLLKMSSSAPSSVHAQNPSMNQMQDSIFAQLLRR